MHDFRMLNLIKLFIFKTCFSWVGSRKSNQYTVCIETIIIWFTCLLFTFYPWLYWWDCIMYASNQVVKSTFWMHCTDSCNGFGIIVHLSFSRSTHIIQQDFYSEYIEQNSHSSKSVASVIHSFICKCSWSSLAQCTELHSLFKKRNLDL